LPHPVRGRGELRGRDRQVGREVRRARGDPRVPALAGPVPRVPGVPPVGPRGQDRGARHRLVHPRLPAQLSQPAPRHGPTHSRHGPTHRVESFCAAFSQVPGRNPLTDRLNAGGGVWGRGWARAGLGAGAGAGGCWGWGAGRARAVDRTVRTSPEVGTPVPAVTMSVSAPAPW